MRDIPMVYLWMGTNIEELSRDELIQVCKELSKQLDGARSAMLATIKIESAARRAREAFK